VIKNAYVSAYDLNHPSWGASAEDAWCAIGKAEFMAGGFVWTGFDYKGEPTPYGKTPRSLLIIGGYSRI
jgi:beta-galactosidase